MVLASTEEPDTSRGYVLAVSAGVTLGIGLIMTILRVYVRLRMIKLFGWDDVCNIIATAMTVVVVGLESGAIANGLGRHVEYVPTDNAIFAFLLLRVTEVFLILSTIFLKISICLFLLRIFTASRPWTIFLWCFIAFNTATSLLDIAVIFPQCTPTEYVWNKTIEGHCWSDTTINGIGFFQGTIAALTDFILAAVPILFLWDIKIRLRVKIGICAIMALGFASGVCAVVRTTFIPALAESKDPTWDLVNLYVWATLESNIAIIACAMPSVRPLLGGNSRRGGTHKSSTAKSASRGGTMSWRQSAGKRIYDDETQHSGDDEFTLFPFGDGTIQKTTDVHVSYTKDDFRHMPQSDEEMLRPDAHYYDHKSHVQATHFN